MDAFCSICGQGYDIRDPAITLHPGPEWECAIEALTRPFTPGDPS